MEAGVSKCALDDDELRRLRAEGLSYRDIGALAGVTKQAICIRLRKQPRGASSFAPFPPPSPATGALADGATPIRAYRPLLSLRAWNALVFWGRENGTVADVRALGTGLLRAPNLGIVSFAELYAVFGVPCHLPPKIQSQVDAIVRSKKFQQKE
jgi:hypothetical protein